MYVGAGKPSCFALNRDVWYHASDLSQVSENICTGRRG